MSLLDDSNGGNTPMGSDPGSSSDGPGPAGTFDYTKLLSTLLPLLGVGSQAAGTALQAQHYNDAADYLKQIGALAQGQNQAGQFAGGGTLDQQRSFLTDLLSGNNRYSSLLDNGLIPNIATLNNLLPSLTNGSLLYDDPIAVNALRNMTDLSGNTQGMLAMAARLLNSGGITDTQVPLGQFSSQLMNGGTPAQRSLMGAGQGLLGGTTPEMQQALSTVNGLIGQGGRSPLTDQLGGIATSLASKNPLLGNDQAVSFALDSAGRNYANAAHNARTQANARGAGAGSVVANGAGNGEMGDASDAALQGTSNAVQQALLSQQGLGLQQQMGGLQSGLTAADIQRSTQAGGLSALTNLLNTATNRTGTGANILNDVSGSQVQGGNLYNQLLQLQQGNMVQGFQAGSQNVQNQAQLMQQAINDLFAGRTGSANIGNTLGNLYLQNQNQLSQAIGSGMNSNLAAGQQLGQQGNTWLDWAGNALNNLSNTGRDTANMTANSPWSTFLSNLGGSLGASGSSGSNGALNAAIAAGIGGLTGLAKGKLGGNNNFDFGGGTPTWSFDSNVPL